MATIWSNHHPSVRPTVHPSTHPSSQRWNANERSCGGGLQPGSARHVPFGRSIFRFATFGFSSEKSSASQRRRVRRTKRLMYVKVAISLQGGVRFRSFDKTTEFRFKASEPKISVRYYNGTVQNGNRRKTHRIDFSTFE